MKTFVEQLEQDEIDDGLWYIIVDFIADLEEEILTVEMRDRYYEIIEELYYSPRDDDEEIDSEYEEAYDPEQDEELDEASRKRVKISNSEKIKRKKLYRKNKVKIKKKLKKYRKTSTFKKYKKKSKRMSKRGKTASGKRQTKYV